MGFFHYAMFDHLPAHWQGWWLVKVIGKLMKRSPFQFQARVEIYIPRLLSLYIYIGSSCRCVKMNTLLHLFSHDYDRMSPKNLGGHTFQNERIHRPKPKKLASSPFPTRRGYFQRQRRILNGANIKHWKNQPLFKIFILLALSQFTSRLFFAHKFVFETKSSSDWCNPMLDFKLRISFCFHQPKCGMDMLDDTSYLSRLGCLRKTPISGQNF